MAERQKTVPKLSAIPPRKFVARSSRVRGPGGAVTVSRTAHGYQVVLRRDGEKTVGPVYPTKSQAMAHARRFVDPQPRQAPKRAAEVVEQSEPRRAVSEPYRSELLRMRQKIDADFEKRFGKVAPPRS